MVALLLQVYVVLCFCRNYNKMLVRVDLCCVLFIKCVICHCPVISEAQYYTVQSQVGMTNKD